MTVAAPSRWQRLIERYASADLRSLGLLRLLLGTLLVGDLLRRIPDLEAHYSNAGWHTNHYALFHPVGENLFSLYLAAGPLPVVALLFALHLAVAALYLVGFRTRLMQVLIAVLTLSLESRQVMLENGGFIVLNLLVVWTAFLPLGARFSIDAWSDSWRRRRDGSVQSLNDHGEDGSATRIVSLAVTALLLQWAVIYYFNTVHKGGPTWRGGTAVYYFFEQDRMLTAFGAFIRHYLPLWTTKLLTWGTLVIEGAIVILLLSPYASGRARMIAWGLAIVLHLSIAAIVQLGPFSWAMMAAFAAFVPSEAWQELGRRARSRRGMVRWYFDEGSRGALVVAGVLRRLDALRLLEFRPARPDTSGGWYAESAAGERLHGDAALRRVLRVVPLSPLLCLPGMHGLLSRLLRRVEREAWPFDFSDVEPGVTELAAPPSDALRAWQRTKRGAATIAVGALMLAAVSQVLVENSAVPEALKPDRPKWLEAAVVYPRMFQGWSMFAPNPPAEDGKIVVDAETVDGRRVDPLTGAPPDFDVQPRGGFRLNQLWGDFHRRMPESRFAHALPGFRDYLLRYPERTGRAQDALRRFDVIYVSEDIPPPGVAREPPTRRTLLSHSGLLATPVVPVQPR